MNENGYVPKRRGVLEHLQDGRLTLLQLGAHDVLLLLADKSTGIWNGSAKALAANCGAGDITERQARHIVESLESKGYIKRFPTRRSHRNYPILIHRYQVTFGAYKGMRLNAAASIDWKNPLYEKCQGNGAERAPYQEGEEEGETKPCATRSGSRDGACPEHPNRLQDDLAAIRRVWNYYIEKLDKNPKLLSFTDLRKKKGLLRLRECAQKVGGDLGKAEELMRLAVDALAGSGFHRGENDRKRAYDSWERNLFASQEQLEGWLDQ